MNQDTKFKDRLSQVCTWLRDSGWTPTATDFDYKPLEARAKTEFGYAHIDRARGLVAKAARLLRGEYVESLRGGAQKRYAHLRAALGGGYVIELKSLDISIYVEAAATILNGDGETFEWQFKMKNMRGETVDVIGTLRLRESDD